MALVTKILETTLAAGATSVTFNDADIPNSLIRVFATNSNIYPLNISLSGNILTVTYEAQGSSMGVALEISKQGLEIVDGVSSTAADKALSANQGKLLNDDITTVSGDLSDLSTTVAGLVIPDEITDLSDVNVTSIQDGQVLAWDDVSQKFVNVNQSGGSGSDDYSTTEQAIGKWINNETIYRKVFKNTGTDISCPYNTWTALSFAVVTNLSLVINARVYDANGTNMAGSFARTGANLDTLAFLNVRNATITLPTNSMVVLEYIKSV